MIGLWNHMNTFTVGGYVKRPPKFVYISDGKESCTIQLNVHCPWPRGWTSVFIIGFGATAVAMRNAKVGSMLLAFCHSVAPPVFPKGDSFVVDEVYGLINLSEAGEEDKIEVIEEEERGG